MIIRELTLANSGGQVGELSMQHAHPRILHQLTPKDLIVCN